MAAIKQEPGAGPQIKPDPGMDGSSQSPKLEPTSDDEYEDAGDLDMSNGDRGLWLVKLPKYLLEKWETLDDEEEIDLGTIYLSADEKVRSIYYCSSFVREVECGCV